MSSRLFEIELVGAFFSLIASDIIVVAADDLRRMEIISEDFYIFTDTAYPFLLLVMFGFPILGFVFSRKFPLAGPIRNVIAVVSVIPLITWIVFVSGLWFFEKNKVRAIHLKDAANESKIYEVAQQERIPMVIKLQSGVVGWTVYVDAKYLPQALELCKGDLR